MAGLQVLDVLLGRMSLRNCVACSGTSSFSMAGAASTSRMNILQQQQAHGYATHTNILGGLRPMKGSTQKVSPSL